MINNEKLIKQLQYYLSENNLQNDQFFYKEVASNKQHYVDVKHFLNCNKIKGLGVKKPEQIIEAANESQTLEVNPTKTMIKRKGLDQLPEFKPKKKVKTDEKPQDEIQNPFQNLETVIFCLKVEKDQVVPFRYIQQGLLKNHNLYSPYVRFNKNQGNFAIQKNLCTPQLIDKLQKEGLKVGNTKLIINKASEQQINDFWSKHGHHYNGIIDNLRKQHAKKAKQQRRNQQKNKKVVQFEFGGQKYNDINKLKSLFKNILCKNPNNIPLKQKQEILVKQLLSYHQKGQEKMKDIKHFVVDVNPNYADTRCFFVVRNDGTRQDFSVVKCVEKIAQKFAA